MVHSKSSDVIWIFSGSELGTTSSVLPKKMLTKENKEYCTRYLIIIEFTLIAIYSQMNHNKQMFAQIHMNWHSNSPRIKLLKSKIHSLLPLRSFILLPLGQRHLTWIKLTYKRILHLF